jgi:hypothetical protein
MAGAGGDETLTNPTRSARVEARSPQERWNMRRKLLKALAGMLALAGIGSALLTGTANAAANPLHNVKLVSPNGLCLTSLNASVGQFPVQTGCSAAHVFVFDTAHLNIFVEGHPGACIASGDPGLELVIEPCSNGRSVIQQDPTPLTIGQTTYVRLRFVHEGTYAHANGNGQNVTMITSPGSSEAVYWELLPVA